MIIFGGSGAQGFLGDTWVLSHANGQGGTSVWNRLFTNIHTPATTKAPLPSSRYNNVVIDTANNLMIMFGGGASNDFTEGPAWSTWVLSHPDGL
jgi:hypothetical protein